MCAHALQQGATGRIKWRHQESDHGHMLAIESAEHTVPASLLPHSLPVLARTPLQVVGMEQVDRLRVAGAARRRAAQFSDQRFQKEFLACLVDVLPLGRDSEPPRNLLQ